MNLGLHYNINLPQDLTSILEQDFWMLENIGAAMLNTLSEPIKFAASSWIFIFKGTCKADINLVTYDIKAPAVVSVQSSQIMQPKYLSHDFNATVMVVSKRLAENLFMFMNNSPLSALAARHPVTSIPDAVLPAFERFIQTTRDIVSDTGNPYGLQALLYNILYFIHREGYKVYEPYTNEIVSRQGRMSDQFLRLGK